MSRISSQGSVIMIQSEVAPTSSDVVSATKAKPCVITLAAAGPAVGDIVMPQNTGWASLDGRPFKVSAVTTVAITLQDSDTTNEVDAIQLGTVLQPSWLELCRSTFNVSMPAGAVIDVTTLCDMAHRITSGLPAIATWAANGFYDSNDQAMLVARDYYRSGQFVAFDVHFPDGSGITYSANVNVFDLTMGINAAVANNLGGNIDGLVSFYPAPAPTGLEAPAEPATAAA
jgi:hypothetical protein